VEPFTHRFLRRAEESVEIAERRPPSDLSKRILAADMEQFAGRWIALLDQRVVANDETPAGLMRKVWESHFPIDDVQIQFVEAPNSDFESKVG
jgi:hypothetical protein